MAVRYLAAILAFIALGGCQSTEQMLDKEQDQATGVALKRAQFEMNCPSATGTVLSRKMVEPEAIRFGVQRAEYTVGIAGCDKRTTMVVVCPQDNSGCFAGE
jgi:hypothetical protein